MIVGIPKEIWSEERRVALTPAGVYALSQSGHTVIVQSGAGDGCRFSDETFREAGAAIAFSSEEVFARADLVVKVMPPTEQECGWISEGRILFSAMNLGSANPGSHEILRSKRVLGVGLELIEDYDGNLPGLTAMSEIAGMMAPQIAARFLETTHGGRGVMLGGVAGIPASNVLILGAGTVGTTAARVFLAFGVNVMIMDEELGRLRNVELRMSQTVNTALATPYNIERYIALADVVVGAVLIHGRKAPHVVTDRMVQKMRPDSVILDISIDQGGCVETSRPTTLSDPVFKKHNVTHYCVPNIPSSVARTASYALNNVMLSYVEEVGEKGRKALTVNPGLQRGVYLLDGYCTHEGLAGLLGWEHTDIESLLT
jgi:alanine dehydrogenase